MLPKTTFVLGGAASGKSAYAEFLVLGTGLRPVYLATAEALDAEMRARIGTHTARRGAAWDTIETPLDAAGALAACREDQACLLDCATLWLSNHLLAGSDLAAEQARLLEAIAACPARLVIVSNEAGCGVVPDNALARQFREAQGRLNIALAGAADLAVQVTAGLPRALKGSLP